MLTTLALFAPALVPIDPLPGGDALVAYSKRVGVQTTAYAELEGPAGAPFALFAQLIDVEAQAGAIDLGASLIVAEGFFDGAGRASVSVPVPGALPAGTQFAVAAGYASQGQVWLGSTAPLPISETANSIPLDFDYAPGFDEPVAGQTIVGDYIEIGLVVSAINDGFGPNQAIIFDSANPTGGDTDLATPGYGLANDTALGNLLIIAENSVDADNDGLVDDPDDEREGGILVFDFAEPTEIDSMTVVDIDDAQMSEIRVTQDGLGVTTYPLVDVGDNGVQTIVMRLTNVTKVELDLGGSGALAEIALKPCPITVDFNETPTGKPLDFPAGTEMTNQYNDVGLTFAALNGTPGGPDKCIIFDSGNPTGGDDDLGTPGYGDNNDTFLGNLLIIAENDVDANNDGLVDDPDDNQDGGIIFMGWDQDIRLISFKVIDVDSTEIDAVRLFDSNNMLILEADLGPIGDNSVQEFFQPGGVSGVRRAELIFSGSGGVDSIRWCPDTDDSTVPGT
ncbi:hypothetical protein [Engelhardtia mirabilis]|uniref:Uncharacterized protein n=1 Tax=Engelhardtia mirabilis TaxID=2528011 RepID=A0A518BS70_9BACT|nr:hypothetical protein Pla133_49440 [Planctomycetes bacterium Pla133]QDV04148.1 hypothetical protein Pla86_49420 [Planctomycetes bacterium Pla86]